MKRIQLNKKEENIKKLNQKENEIKNINDTLTYEKNYKVTFKDTSKDILTITLKDYEMSFKLLGK